MTIMFRKLLCKLGYHTYYVIKHFDIYTRRVGCRYCRKTWGMNDRCKAFIEWDTDLANVHRIIDNYY